MYTVSAFYGYANAYGDLPCIAELLKGIKPVICCINR
jgi:hypothetical protein